jgi:ATP dependent DNA ligase domain
LWPHSAECRGRAGEIVCVDASGRPQFKDLLSHHDDPCFFAFDLLTCDGKDLRTERLLDRKQELRRLLARSPATSPMKYTEYIDGLGMALFQRVRELDLEGIVAKQKFGPYVTEREHSTWFKILNRRYSQKQGREELFERERHSEPGTAFVCVRLCRIRGSELSTMVYFFSAAAPTGLPAFASIRRSR